MRKWVVNQKMGRALLRMLRLKEASEGPNHGQCVVVCSVCLDLCGQGPEFLGYALDVGIFNPLGPILQTFVV